VTTATQTAQTSYDETRGLSAVLDLAHAEEAHHWCETLENLAQAEKHWSDYLRARERRRQLQALIPTEVG
jgi:hypothetical protein